MKAIRIYALSFLILFVLILPATLYGIASTKNADIRLNQSQSEVVPAEPILFNTRQEFVDSFERANLAPWTTYGYPGSVVMVTFGMRDTTNTYGPQTPAHSGYRYPGHPNTDVALYPSPGSNPGNATCLESPTIDLTGWDSLFISFSYWGDFEGTATNFDGFILQISSDNGSTWTQVDANHLGHLIPSYDQRLANTGLLGTAWAYCYDTRPNWVDVASLNLMALGYVAPGNQMKIRFVFAYDALDGGQGCFLDDIRIASTPPQDLQPPTIDHGPLSDTPDTVNDYLVIATITDPGSGVNPDSVTLNYLIEGGSWTQVTMQETSPDVYEANIPAQHYHTDIWYYIRAVDNAGNGTNTLTYNFEVTSAITIFYDDGQPYWIPGGLGIGSGMFVRFDFAPVGIDSGLLHKVKFFFSRAGNFDLRVYNVGTGGAPGQLIYTKPNLQSPGYDWYTEEISNANIRLSTGAVVGFIIGQPIGNDTVSCLMDPALNYQQNMWIYQNNQWGNPVSGGDFMIRLKVIPLPQYGIKEGSNKNIVPTLELTPNLIDGKGGIVRYTITDPQTVLLKIYDVSGKIIRTLVNKHQEPGNYTVHWNGRDDLGKIAPAGVYFFTLETLNSTLTKKAILVR
ncbi:MAG: FlgD immunoglobulin-like domain containing protein [candidate division WOR-3 bacterium]